MTRPRAHVFDPLNVAAYHCCSRCVRGAMLCGTDAVVSGPLAKRRDWIESRIFDLCESFAVGLHAWAIMGNHHHLVLVVDPQLPQSWTSLEVAQRWCRLTRMPGSIKDPQRFECEVTNLLMNTQRLEDMRQRLGSLSWFMSALNEGIARRANLEDGCKGRFWQGRFDCQKLLEETAMLAAMAYADLNPIRAGVAMELHDSRYTGIHRRLGQLASREVAADAPLKALAGPVDSHTPDLCIRQYVGLVDWTGRQQRSGKAAIHAAAPPALARINCEPAAWLELSASIQTRFASAVGSEKALTARARSQNLSWLRGIRLARELKPSSE
ncbi:MAG: transposase [Gammaproteobacteria bacterium]|nr:transposase [Gammaproteobacteria bacterium]